MPNLRKKENCEKIAVIGNYLPRQCGIATFTTDLSQAISKELSTQENLINVAIDDIPQGYCYPPQVKFRIRQNVQSDYFWAADYLNANQYSAAIVQHEYGIYGGENGSHILQMIQALKMPVITNLHTVLENPLEGQKKVMKGLVKYSDRLLVMSKKAIDILTNVYGIDREMIEFIPHGIPDAGFKSTGVFNSRFGLEGKDIILTFGLLGPDKGIEYMIEAMPLIVKENPNAIYVILGQTHPNIIEKSGDSYRNFLQQLVNKLGMQNNIIFYNQFVKLETLIQYLQTAKIYAVPYLKKEQITSGTLSYALGVGTAVVSTPFWYAEELLAQNRGKLVPFADSAQMAKEINNLLADERERELIRTNGYQFAKSMLWKEVAKSHLNLITKLKDRKYIENTSTASIKYHNIFNELPEINLSHLKIISDDTGLLQHSKYTIPNYDHGYCVDDNTRGLIAVTKYYSLRKEKEMFPLIQRYLAFLLYAFNRQNGRFRNFMSYDRRWLESYGSEDSHARALWGLGVAVKESPDNNIRKMAMILFLDAIRAAEDFTSPRAWAYTVLGLQAYLTIYGGDVAARKIRDNLAQRIYELFKKNASDTWFWCENLAAYANAVLPHALIVAGKWIPDYQMYETGIRALEWLLAIQTALEGHISIIGNKGWCTKNGKRAIFDQQPIEIQSLINACLDAYISTGDKKWFKECERCFSWFLGHNDLKLPIYDHKTGGCCDGLESQGVNENQGAESTLAWLISLIDMYIAIGLEFHLEDVAPAKDAKIETALAEK